MEPTIVHGPVPPDLTDQPLFHVTMPNGAVLTRATSFAPSVPVEPTPAPVVSESGQVLRPRED